MNDGRAIQQVIARWRERQAEWARLHVQVDGAALLVEVIATLERIADGEGRQPLTLTNASELSGYSTDHLARLIRSGKLANHGKKGKPLIRYSDLPVRPKSGAIAGDANKTYDPNTDARSLRVRR